jgi:hypothetical protein
MLREVYGRLPRSVDEDPYLAEYEEFMPRVKRLWKRVCNEYIEQLSS